MTINHFICKLNELTMLPQPCQSLFSESHVNVYLSVDVIWCDSITNNDHFVFEKY